ncbi:hypothetical protein GPN2_21797 [Streptomyces murinus]
MLVDVPSDADDQRIHGGGRRGSARGVEAALGHQGGEKVGRMARQPLGEPGRARAYGRGEGAEHRGQQRGHAAVAGPDRHRDDPPQVGRGDRQRALRHPEDMQPDGFVVRQLPGPDRVVEHHVPRRQFGAAVALGDDGGARVLHAEHDGPGARWAARPAMPIRLGVRCVPSPFRPQVRSVARRSRFVARRVRSPYAIRLPYVVRFPYERGDLEEPEIRSAHVRRHVPHLHARTRPARDPSSPCLRAVDRESGKVPSRRGRPPQWSGAVGSVRGR